MTTIKLWMLFTAVSVKRFVDSLAASWFFIAEGILKTLRRHNYEKRP